MTDPGFASAEGRQGTGLRSSSAGSSCATRNSSLSAAMAASILGDALPSGDRYRQAPTADRTALASFARPPPRWNRMLGPWGPTSTETARPLPEVFAPRYGSVTPGDRGGIVVRGMRLKVPLEPE